MPTSTPKERPILFSGEMVRAILDGRKTQTRRVIKPQPGGRVVSFDSTDGQWYSRSDGHHIDWLHRCPYGQPGDRLWVRECWAHYQPVLDVRPPDGRIYTEISDGSAAYRADGFDTIEDCREHLKMMHGSACKAIEIRGDRWRPSIHMPRWASRITLGVVGVRVERVQDIREEGAKAEGVNWDRSDIGVTFNARDQFMRLWDSINAKRGYAWEDNPWVFAVTFSQIDS